VYNPGRFYRAGEDVPPHGEHSGKGGKNKKKKPPDTNYEVLVPHMGMRRAVSPHGPKKSKKKLN